MKSRKWQLANFPDAFSYEVVKLINTGVHISNLKLSSPQTKLKIKSIVYLS